ncbi:hypothetical protein METBISCDRAFT_18825 [Metschnikowia bicuspidata]|uniref:RFX-type winged-helix domain-containing protein n=1 Tax=Metschnikowia bicuspidata TaxID=27322 RepID=A0A4P9ZC03_9ASCO|nr:hypothetical protein METBISCDRAFT_18825 [Metschnikowia bicuspidata]
MERHLKLLVSLAAGCTYANLAERVKNLDAKDPVFGSVCNPKDIRINKHHQLFALMWLSRQCKTSYSTVVTRTRVYTHYVDICNKQDLPPLISCSFGKLVRVLFPNLTTRRLGVRGKSRYYYCGLKLIGHLDNLASPVSPSTTIGPHSLLFVRINTAGELDAIVSIAGAPRLNLSRFNEHFNVIELRYIPGLFTKIENSVKSANKSAPLKFPCVLSYVPEDMDVDYAMAESLQKAYKAHLNSVFDLIRYVQPEKLFELCSALLADVGPACKLMVDEQLARWVKDCDLIMLRAAMKMLARLYSQNVPVMIVDPLKTLAKELHLRVKDLMEKQFPALFVDLKMRELGQFVDLLKLLLSCIESSNHISTILSNSNHKVVMLNDWLLLDIPDIIMRELPCGSANVDKLVELLETRLVKLLGDLTSSRPVMAKYSEFLFQLPGEFPDANPWLFLLLASNVLTTCIREMTLQGSRSFKSWWILRCWVDEFIKWSLELGGYLHDDFEQQIQPVVKTETFEEPQSFDYQFSLERHNDNYYVDLLELPENGSLN